MRWYRPISLCFSSWNTTINPRKHPDENSERQQEDELMQAIRAGEEHSDRTSSNPGSNRRGQLWPDTSWSLVQKVHSYLQLNRSLLWQISELSAIDNGTIRTLTNRNQPEEAPLCWEILKWAGKSRESLGYSLAQEDFLVLCKWGSTTLLETPGQVKCIGK